MSNKSTFPRTTTPTQPKFLQPSNCLLTAFFAIHAGCPVYMGTLLSYFFLPFPYEISYWTHRELQLLSTPYLPLQVRLQASHHKWDLRQTWNKLPVARKAQARNILGTRQTSTPLFQVLPKGSKETVPHLPLRARRCSEGGKTKSTLIRFKS